MTNEEREFIIEKKESYEEAKKDSNNMLGNYTLVSIVCIGSYYILNKFYYTTDSLNTLCTLGTISSMGAIIYNLKRLCESKTNIKLLNQLLNKFKDEVPQQIEYNEKTEQSIEQDIEKEGKSR